MYELMPLEFMTLEIERERSRHRVPQTRMLHEPIVPVALHTHRRTLEIAIFIMISISLATLISAMA
jgi:hypothetical protein